MSRRETFRRLANIGEDPEKLSAILIAHEHSDHISGLPTLMKKLGITKQQDEEWHRTHLTLSELRAQALAGTKHINAQSLAAGFLAWCVQQGWLRQKGKQYFATQEGETELRQRFGIEL